MRKGFGRSPSDMGNSHVGTRFTEWSANKDNSETFFNQTSAKSGVFEDNFRCTNYELALEFGKNPTAFIEPTSKPMKAIYIFPKDPPINLTPGFEEIQAQVERKDLPLVEHPGAFASKRKWDNKGTIRIRNHTSIRFGHDSYIAERRLKSVDVSAPLDLPDANRSFHRPTSHMFPGLKTPPSPKYVNQKDKKALYRDIITAKVRPTELINVLRKEKRYKASSAFGPATELPISPNGHGYNLGRERTF